MEVVYTVSVTSGIQAVFERQMVSPDIGLISLIWLRCNCRDVRFSAYSKPMRSKIPLLSASS